MSRIDSLLARLSENKPGGELTELTEPRKSGSVSFVSDRAGHISTIPASIVMGLHSLRDTKPDIAGTVTAWREVVSDARALAAEGWAAQALALGWSPVDLFGVLDGTRESLAVWLRGRRMLLIDADCAVAHRDGEPPAYYLRRELPGAKLLWELRNGISVTNQEKRHD